MTRLFSLGWVSSSSPEDKSWPRLFHIPWTKSNAFSSKENFLKIKQSLKLFSPWVTWLITAGPSQPESGSCDSIWKCILSKRKDKGTILVMYVGWQHRADTKGVHSIEYQLSAYRSYDPQGHPQPHTAGTLSSPGHGQGDEDRPNPAFRSCQKLAGHLSPWSVIFFFLPMKEQPGCVQAADGVMLAWQWIPGYVSACGRMVIITSLWTALR